MSVKLWTGVAAIALGASLAFAQEAPESLLPPGFDDPAPAPAPAPRPTAAPQPGGATAPSVPPAGGTPVIQDIPDMPEVPSIGGMDLSKIPSLEELEAMSPDELDELLGLKPKFDIPPAARRSMAKVGILSSAEGGLPSASLAKQPASLVRAALQGTDGPMVSRWGHILMRRALVSRLAAPEGMNPVEFAALRAKVLNGMGEFAAARGLVQDVDAGNWNTSLTDQALSAYVATGDIVGACPAVRVQGSAREDAQWKMLQAICNAYAGEGALAGTELDRALRQGIAPRIDILLAQRFAGAAGRGRRAVDIEWDDVDGMTPWRFALASAVGEEIPDNLQPEDDGYYQRVSAFAPMLPLISRAIASDRAAREGLMSSRAMVDLYSQIYADDTIAGDEALRASRLREAYVSASPGDRIAAMRDVWGGTDTDYGRLVLTAYAAARVPASEDLADDADKLIASMLTAGLDRDAAAWAGVVDSGSLAWALIALSSEADRQSTSDEIDGFIDDDNSASQRKSRFLLAGLAGLNRIASDDLADFTGRVETDLGRQTKWTRTIDKAADVGNPALVALLAGLGMQGENWAQMTPLHLYHIVSALNRVGLKAEARMIAAEAVARG